MHNQFFWESLVHLLLAPVELDPSLSQYGTGVADFWNGLVAFDGSP